MWAKKANFAFVLARLLKCVLFLPTMQERSITGMRIVMVIENLMGGGAQLFALRLADALRSKGVDVRIVLLFDHLENKELTGLFPQVPVVGLRLPNLRFWTFLDRWLFRLRLDFSFVEFFQSQQIKRKYLHGVTAVHTHYIKTDYQIGRLLRNSNKIRHIVTVHGDYSHQYEHYQKHGRAIWNRLQTKLRWLSSSVDKWIVVSDEQRDFFTNELRFPLERIIKIYNGFAAEQNERLDAATEKNSFTIGMLARGVEEKGWEVLIKAFLRLPDTYRLLLGGRGDYLQILATKYASEPGVVFLGYQNDPIAFIKQCDLVALPSERESLPYVIIEALACAKPVVASDVGEIKQMLTADDSGELAGEIISLENGQVNEDDLYTSLLRFATNENLLAQKSRLAQKAFTKFDMEACVLSYMRVYSGR